MKTESIISKNGRFVVGRILPNVELIEGIEILCKENEIKSGVIISLIGSLSCGRIVYPIPDENSKIGIRYSEETDIKGPLELLSCQGYIGEGEDGEFQIHLHGLMGNENMEIIGGHFVSNGNKILATAEITIMKVDGGNLVREFDEKLGFPLFNFKQK
ncbi:MAG: DUF296 domain-containing protein [Tissierellia bacterium]|nr:DUF296 domain-containing protein [Tissierellia bacterium]